MILTFKKSELLKKLQAAKAAEIKAVEKRNSTIDDEYENDRNAAILKCQQHIEKLLGAQRDIDSKYLPSLSKRKLEKVSTAKYDTAIFMLENCSEDTVTLNSERDKLGLGDAIKAALS